MCCLLVSGFFTEITQQIHSLRASGVMSSHFSRAAESEMRAFRRSAGTVCAAPGDNAFLAMNSFYRLCRGEGVALTNEPHLLLSANGELHQLFGSLRADRDFVDFRPFVMFVHAQLGLRSDLSEHEAPSHAFAFLQ
jgi:hypothetical protein